MYGNCIRLRVVGPRIHARGPMGAGCGLMFSLVSARYERASRTVTSNKAFAAWGEIFGDEVTATAMVDRLVHHAEVLSLKGDSYRIRDKDPATPEAG
jgi:DNA replication protein DnaC